MTGGGTYTHVHPSGYAPELDLSLSFLGAFTKSKLKHDNEIRPRRVNSK